MPATATPSTIPSSYRLAKLTGFHRAHIHRVLHLNSGATLDFAIRLARAAGVTLDELAAHVYKDCRLMKNELGHIDGRRADWLNEEAKKRRQLSASNGSAESSKTPKRRRK